MELGRKQHDRHRNQASPLPLPDLRKGKGMSQEIDIFKVLDYLRDNAPLYGAAKGNRVAIEEGRKALKARLMKRHIDLPVTAQEREAYADPEYQELINGLGPAVEMEETLRWMLEAARIKAEIWRTLESNKRAEAKAL